MQLKVNVGHIGEHNMSMEDFSGTCFVAFTYISGFKTMMKEGERAVRAIDTLYNAGFNVLANTSDVNGLFISDCGILFSRNQNQNQRQQLEVLLDVVCKLNQQVLHNDIMLTTSIAWGEFSYHNRIEFPGINKQPIYGNAYVSAFLDIEKGVPRIQPGQCRIIKHGVPTEIFSTVAQQAHIENAKAHWYYYWMVKESEHITEFKSGYQDSYNLKYAGMLNAIKRHT